MTENFPNLFSKIDFGNEAADHMKPAEIKELIKYFVELDVFSSFQDPKKSFQIACAKKGVGKSALIQWLRHTLTKKEQNSIVISIKKHDLDFESLVSNPLTLQRNLDMTGHNFLLSVRQVRTVISSLNPLHQFNGHVYVEFS